ncbi:MAG: MbcA/ParS/Xre antitoxin family protein [Gammaproteobacteria bacterium]|nr:MbcA/ParS/Xre antitoxin family protein [Gammaproteobacteria bacterium]MDH5214860.1 MbcA/ParS/Xre antitoxin family protein [Gammaproteobacteria bacterium]
MVSARHQSKQDPSQVLGTAVLRAAERMGLSRPELAKVLGRDRSSISRSGVDPESKSGELAKILIRCYRALAVMVDDNPQQIREWLSTRNWHTGGIPHEQLQSVGGLVAVSEYLDAIRGKV